MNANRYVAPLWRTLAPWVCLRMSGEDIAPSLWNGHDWEESALADLPQPTLLGHYIWLIAEEHTCFRNRSFPADMIDAKNLNEAVALDARTWSPWGEESEYFYWPVLDGEVWQVAVWVWDAGKENALRARILANSGIILTHVIPEQAWRASGAEIAAIPALLLWSAGESVSCLWMDERGLPARIAVVSNEAEGVRFRRSLGGSTDGVGTVFLLDGRQLPSWVGSGPEEKGDSLLSSERKSETVPFFHDSRPGPIKLHPPSGRVLVRARLPGVQDWTDPVAWKKPLAALAILCLLWLAGSSVILWNRSAAVDAELRQARASAEDVLSLRDRVRRMEDRLKTIHGLRHRQGRELRFLAALTKKLPPDAWLLSVVDEGGSVNIQGRAKNAAVIGALLERIPGIDHVAYLGDIRPDPASKRESFYLRLHFSEAGNGRRKTEDERRF